MGAYDMGLIKSLPNKLQSPVASRAVFMVGHFSLFAAGLPYVHCPFIVQSFFICVATCFAFKNGAAFYITYFWKVYDHQIHAFESQMREAEAQAQAVAQDSAADLDADTDDVCAGGDSPEHDAEHV